MRRCMYFYSNLLTIFTGKTEVNSTVVHLAVCPGLYRYKLSTQKVHYFTIPYAEVSPILRQHLYRINVCTSVFAGTERLLGEDYSFQTKNRESTAHIKKKWVVLAAN
jgi:hypothetical protein